VLACACLLCASSNGVAAAEGTRRIEEVVVTAERRESTVSDTSIAISAFPETMIQDFGMQGPEDIVNFTPSTTVDAYDIRIRGVGRNFRALGGDPGVATYYNGVYSEDFGIAATEDALYDVARIEVLRGPQGTLYGRNAIGGALNYITNRPSWEPEGEVRVVTGSLGSEEYYGILSGPLLKDTLAYRLTGMSRHRDGAQKGIDGSEDIDSVGDHNVAVALQWRMTGNMEFNVRWNDRDSNRRIGVNPLVTEGTSANRGERSVGLPDIPTWQYAYGIQPVPAPIFGVVPYTGPMLSFTDPATGAPVAGIYTRPGVDRAEFPIPNSAWRTNPDTFDPDVEHLNGWALTNNQNKETFEHNAVQADWVWDLSDRLQVKWIGGWMDFDYKFLIDGDSSTSTLTIFDTRVKQSLESWSNELQLLWKWGDKLDVTSGVYYFDQNVRQQFDAEDKASQGRLVRPTQYGGLEPLAAAIGPSVGLGDAAPGTLIFGRFDGDPYGRLYAIDNTVVTEAFAVYTQGTYTFNEHWALTLGVRYALDQKAANEQRGAYSTLAAEDVNAFLQAAGAGSFDDFCLAYYTVPCATAGLTDLAIVNIFMGNASPVPTFDPQMPITPTCALDDQDCLTPLRLQGLPISGADHSKGKEQWHDTNFRVNVDWTPTENHLLYAGVTTGYRSGGYSLGLLGTQTLQYDANGNPIPFTRGPPRSYNDETVVAYELGYKGALLDDRLQVFSALYYYDYDGYQDEVEELNSVGGSDNVVINAGNAVNYGWEIEGTWLATDKWTVGGNFSYAHTEYEDHVYLVEDDNPAVPAPLFAPLPVDLKGNDLKRIPEYKSTAYTWYDFLFAAGTLTLGTTFSYTGDYYSSGINRDLDRVRSRFRSDVYATWQDTRERWYIRGFVDNVTNEGTARQINTGNAGANYRMDAAWLYPRYYGIDVTYRFSHWM